MDNYPALTIKQPYATLIARGLKNIENRSWTTTYRGPLLIHAGRQWADDRLPVDLWMPSRDLFTYGAVIGTVELMDVIDDHTSPWAEPGWKHWVLEDAQLWETPVPLRGQMGLWYPGQAIKT
jgi:hypothetical protein